jgi:hypothetical protein
MHFDDNMTLREARDRLRELVDEGHACPCCAQFAKKYKRKLPSASAKVLIAVYRENGHGEYVFLPDLLDRMTGTAHQGGYGTLSHHWGLLEQMPGARPDGSKRVGWWRLTDLGKRFVLREVRVPQYANIYADRCLGFHGNRITIEDALGTKFNYRELMGE